jgi:hypothetical protein
MSRKFIIGPSFAALLAFTSLGCGQKKDNNENQVKKGLLTTSLPATGASVVGDNPEVKATPAETAAIFAQVPSSSVMVFGINEPEKALAQIKDLAKKLGADIETDPEFQKNREEFKAKIGVDILDPELFSKLGVDASKGIAVAVDTDTMMKKAEPIVGAAATEIEQVPVIFLVAALSSGETFDKTVREAIAKESPDSRFEDVTLGEKDKLTHFYKTKTEGEAKTEVIQASFAQKGGYLYIFLHDEVSKIEDPAAGDVVADYKTTIKSYLEKPVTSITGDANFNRVSKQIDPKSNALFYMDFAKLATIMAAGTESVLYGTPKDDNEKSMQESEKQMRDSLKANKDKDNAEAKKVAEILPQLGVSFSIAADKISMKGSGLLGSTHQDKIQKAIAPAAEAPAFATIFPEDTGFFYRFAINFVGAKELFFSILPEEEKATAMTGYDEAKSEFAKATGLDLDLDLLGAFTGHTAFGAKSVDVFTKYGLAAAANPMGTGLPDFLMVSQFVSAEAGDKLLAKLEEAITKGLGAGMVKSEEVNGDKIYSITFAVFGASWGRSGQTFILGTNAAQVKESFARVKTPGASFAEKLSPAAKMLVTDKNANGITMDIGALFADLANFPDTRPEDKETFTKISSVLNVITFYSNYADAQATMEGELTLK